MGRNIMAIDLYWENDEQTVMLVDVKGKWTWDELHAVLYTMQKLSKEHRRVLGAIVDVSSGLQLPGGSILNQESLKRFNQFLAMGDDGKGPVAVVGMNPMVKSVLDAISMVDKSVTNDVFFVKSIAEGERMLSNWLRQRNVA